MCVPSDPSYVARSVRLNLIEMRNDVQLVMSGAVELEKALREASDSALCDEDARWKQQSRIKCLAEGDYSSQFFRSSGNTDQVII